MEHIITDWKRYLPLLALLPLLAAGCGKKPEADTVKVAYLPIVHALVLQELTQSENVKVELVKYGSWPELLDALNTGRVDAASVLVEPAMKAKEQGIGLTALALGHRDGNVVVVGSDISGAGDLRGKTFAIPHRASSHHILFRELLEKNGIPANEVELIELPPPEMPSALASGRIAGYCVAEPFGAIAVHGGYGKVLYRSQELWPDSVCCALVANDRFLNENPALAAKFREEYLRAGERLENKEEALSVAKALLRQPPEVLARSLEWISFTDLSLPQNTYDDLKAKVVKYGISAAPPSFADFVAHPGDTE